MTERLIIDLAACDGCQSCSVGPAVLALRERATFELVCRRCEHASCVLACPFDALERSAEGIIKRHNMRCVSCKSCALACPFGAPRYGEDGKMSKCHLCVKRVDAGLEPACVRVCPTRALSFGPVDDLSIQKAEKASRNILEALVTNLG